jgi:hypothetical protein
MITINGTTGIAGANGSASTPAVQGEDTNTGVFFPAADTVAVATGGSERMRVDSSGNLGLGVTPSAWTASWKALQISTAGSLQGATDNRVALASNYVETGTGSRYIATDWASAYVQVAGQHRFLTAPSGTAGNAITFTQAMTLDVNGNLLVGTTTFRSRLTVEANSALTAVPFDSNDTRADASSSASFVFRRQGTQVGSINTTTSATSYATSSDYRLKENVQPMQDALATVAQLNPVTYTWIADGSDGQGFIAHELQAVVPDCVAGEKDAVDAEGNPQYQGVDTSFLVATLVKAVQELKAEVDSLKAQLEARN